jgi:organic radical activating enzyme
MSNARLSIPYVEFYITNVCNLSCNGCNRFNNFDFRGFQKWTDYKEVYQQWSQEVNPASIAILGGEPLLNPTFMEWAQGIRELWPTSIIRVITNGFQLDRVKNLYSLLQKRKNIQLWVGIHNKQHKKTIIDKVSNFLQQPVTTKFNDSTPYQEKLIMTDSNNVTVTIEYNWWFHQGSIIRNLDQLNLHQSDPVKAHTNCHMKTCHHFVHGKLYKCGVVAVLLEFDQQHTLTLSAEDRVLMSSYQPLKITNTTEQKKQFIDNLTNPIDQCRFCPEVYHGDMIQAKEKKDLKIKL